MPGLTQEDVTPVIPEGGGGQPEQEEKEEGYQWMRWVTKPGNELQHLWNKATETSKTLNANVDSRGRVGLLKLHTLKDSPGVIRTGPDPVQREGIAGVQEAVADVGLAAINAGQGSLERIVAPWQGRVAQPQDPADTLVGQWLVQGKDDFAEGIGVPRRWEMDEDDTWPRNFASATTSAAIAALLLRAGKVTPGARPNAFTGMRVNPYSSPSIHPSMQTLSKVKGPWGAYWRRNPEWARSAARWLAFGGSESFVTTMISDQRDFGYGDPGDDQFTASLKSLIPNAGEELLTGGLLGLAGKGTQLGANKIWQQWLKSRSSIARNNQSHKLVADVETARQWAQDNGIQQRTGEGSYEFIPDPWETEPVTNTQVRQGIDNAGAVEPDAPRNPREAVNRMLGRGGEEPPQIEWDPSAPEVDTVIRGIDDLDDAALVELGREISEGRNAVEALGEKLNRAQEPTPDVPVGEPSVTNTAALVSDADEFAAVDLPQLRMIAKVDARVQAELAKVNVHPTKAGRKDIINAIVAARARGAATTNPAVIPESALPAEQRNALKTEIVKEAVAKGEVRPSATEPPELPEPTAKDVDDMTPEEIINEEFRLAGDYQAIDNAKVERVLRETREAEGYYDMTPEQQIANGKLDGWEEPAVTGQGFDPLEGIISDPAERFTMPTGYEKSSPRYGMAKLVFQDDLDRAAYILQSGSRSEKALKTKAALRKALEEQGIDIDEVMDLGADIKAQIQDQIEGATGSRKAPQESLTVEIPRSEVVDGLGPLDSEGPNLPGFIMKGPTPEDAKWMSDRLAKMAAERSKTMRTGLEDISRQVFGDDIGYYTFDDNPKRKPRSQSWGGDGTSGPKREIYGTYWADMDLIAINNLLGRKWVDLKSTMFHESWHRIQYGFLNKKEAKIMDNVFGKSDLQNLSQIPFGNNSGITPIEIQAVAFQNYASARQRGISRMGIIREELIAQLEEMTGKQAGWKTKLTAEAFTILSEFWEKLLAFRNRSMNFIEGNGFRNVYDVFEDAWSGRLAASRKFDGFMEVMKEAGNLPEARYNELVRTGGLADLEARLDDASWREHYWHKWQKQLTAPAREIVDQIDVELAALKQQALAGGC